MKLRTLLILANSLSLLIIFVFLFIAYVQMFIRSEIIFLLIGITLLAGLLSFGVHWLITSPLLKSVRQMTTEAERIAGGDFNVKITETGPDEIKKLAQNFNHMSAQINEMFAELKKSEQFKSELITNVSHDLRTPISSIHSFVAALNEEIIEDKPVRKRYYETILSETEKLNNLIEEVLHLSQLENQKIPFDPVPTSMDQLLVETLQQFERVVDDKQIILRVDYDDHIPPAPLMPSLIKRVMTNLIQNAISFSTNHQTISVVTKQRKDRIYFSVTDEGKGVPLEEQSNIFQRFYRLEKSRNKTYGGSGLGLSISKEIIELHHGEIGLISDGEQGSTFWFEIPFG